MQKLSDFVIRCGNEWNVRNRFGKENTAESGNVEIIFITSHFEFIGVGYEVDALHYLVKPVKAGKMEEVLSKAKCKIEAGEPSIIIHYEGEVVKLYEKEILYLESLSHYVTIYTKGKEYKIKANISTFAQKLSEDFYQTHRSTSPASNCPFKAWR